MADYTKRNYFLFLMDAIIFVNAMTCLSTNTVIPYFLNTLGASTFQISLAGILTGVCSLLAQPIFARMAVMQAYKIKALTRILLPQRFFLLASAMSIPFFPADNPQLIIIFFLLCWGIFSFLAGSYSPFYMSLVEKMVSKRQRGRLIGFGNALANLIALGTAYIINLLLKEFAFPFNFAVVLGLGALLLILDAVDFMLMKEPPDKVSASGVLSYIQFFKDIPGILRNNGTFKKTVIGLSLVLTSTVSVSYLVLYAVRRYGATGGAVALFTAIGVVSTALANITLGILADKYSHRLVLQVASICGALAGVIVLSIDSVYAVYSAFALVNIGIGGYYVSGSMFIVQNHPGERLPIFISISVMITLVISSAASLVSSFIIDTFSFMPVFMIAGAAGLYGYIVFSPLYDRFSR